ncbi:MAG: hypothetical protein R3E66_01660 [bacterium]
MRTWMFAWLLVGLVGCETPQKPVPAPEASRRVAQDELADLVAKVQNLRDRAFDTPPAVVAVPNLPANFEIASDACREDRRWLLTTLFGFDASTAERVPWLPAAAAYDPATHTIEYVRTARREDVVRDVVLATVGGLGRHAFSSPPAADTWDGWLATRTNTMSDASFVWALVAGEEIGLTRENLAEMPSLAMRIPEVARTLDVDGNPGIDTLNRRELSFALREGLATSAMLQRSGGWSGAEMAWIAPASNTGFLVRPDRWASGEDLGTWTLPDKSDVLHAGSVGPGVLSLWLSDFISPQVARSIYVSWQSDAYRVIKKGDGWRFEWVSLWRTPDDAQQMTEVIDAALKQRKDAQFTVLRKGMTVAVVGGSVPDAADDRLAEASGLAALTPVFLSGEKPFFTFVPTATDVYALGVTSSTLNVTDLKWEDKASALRLDLSALSDWKLAKAEDFVARFVATKDDATILMSTEMVDPIGPQFSSDAFQHKVLENFQKTLTNAQVLSVTRLDGGELHAVLSGQVAGDVKLAFWMVQNNGVIATFSVKATPAEFEAAYQTAQTIWATRALDGAAKAKVASPSDDGILEFKVEE